MRRLRRVLGRQGGAAAVELALILPLLVALVFGMVELGRAYNAQVSLTGAAREGARVMAVRNDPTGARTATIAAAPSLNPSLSADHVTISPSTCQPGQTVTLTATYPLALSTPVLGTTISLTGRGVMRCGG